MDTSKHATRQQAPDLVEVMKAERTRADGAPIRTTRYLSDEAPEVDFFELPYQWVEPRGK